METKAAAAGIKHRRRKEVIEVYQHREQQDHIDPQPSRTVDKQGNEYRKYEVQEIMNELLHAGQSYG